MSRKISLVAGLLLGLAYAGSAWAHGGGPGLSYDPCAQRVGLYYVHMAVYQPQVDSSQEYCGKIPRGGDTLMVFDLVGTEMRHTPVAVNILETGGRSGSYVVASVPEGEHVSGVIDINLPLQAGHSYQAVVTVGEAPANYTITFPISVNAWWNGLELPGLLVLVVLGGSIFYGLRLRREHLVTQRKAEMRTRIRAVGSG
ncbi:MAG: hypothetical protein WCA22_20810 [Candidatus Binatus sp.]